MFIVVIVVIVVVVVVVIVVVVVVNGRSWNMKLSLLIICFITFSIE